MLVCVLICAAAASADAVSAAQAAAPAGISVDGIQSAADSAGRHLSDAVSGASRMELPDRPIRIAAIAMPEWLHVDQAVAATAKLIAEAFAPHPVQFETVDSETLEDRIRAGTVDAFIASSGYFWRMTPYGVMSVGTLISHLGPDPNKNTAVAFLVRSDDRRLHHLVDLEGRKLGATFSTAFMTYRIGMAEIARMGRDPENFFSEIRFTGRVDQDEIIGMLDSRQVDAVVMGACWLESLPPERQRLYRVLDERSDSLRCRHSTIEYPGIMMAVAQGATPGIAHTIARTILSERHLTGNARWAVATDMRTVDEAYKLLKIEQYAYLRDMSFLSWLKRHWQWPAVAMLFLLGLAVHAWRVSALVHKRTVQLTALMRHREKTRDEVLSLSERMENLRKVTVVGQLSSMFAHEISQPLAAIACYCESQCDLLSSSRPNLKLLKKSCEGIRLAVTRSRDIVDKVRSYNRGGVDRSGAVELAPHVRRVMKALNPTLMQRASTASTCPSSLYVKCDELELDLLLHNLLKNALEAACEMPNPSLTLCVDEEETTVTIVIENSGRRLSSEDVERLRTPFFTTKAHGFGLGISIVSALVEASGGHICFWARPQGGLRVETTLVRAVLSEANPGGLDSAESHGAESSIRSSTAEAEKRDHDAPEQTAQKHKEYGA